MNTWQSLLKDHDPGADARLAAAQADAIRRAAVAAAREPRAVPLRWQSPLAMAAVAGLMIATGVFAGRRSAIHDAAAIPTDGEVRVTPTDPAEPRQLHLATPGGARVSWVFNPGFALGERSP